MELSKLGGRIPTEKNCCQLLRLMEQEYDCCLKFWVDVRMNGSGANEIWLLAYGSGNVFDLLGDSYPVFRARILPVQEGSIYHAMWANLVSMESELRRVAKPRSSATHP